MAPITFAHRGARAVLPENTIPAFRRALEQGAGGLETDVWLAGDGEVVLAHDATVRRGAVGRIRVDREPAARLARYGIPRLADLYTELGAGYDLSVDLKSPGVGAAVVAVARTHGDPARLWLCTPSMSDLGELRGDADVRLVHSRRRRHIEDQLERHAARLAELGVDAMNMHYSEWTAGIVALFHRFEVLAFAWDTQEVRHLRAMLEIGIDAVYCDRPDRMVATVAEWTS